MWNYKQFGGNALGLYRILASIKTANVCNLLNGFHVKCGVPFLVGSSFLRCQNKNSESYETDTSKTFQIIILFSRRVQQQLFWYSFLKLFTLAVCRQELYSRTRFLLGDA